jgi:hypothetical protein
LLNSDNSTLYIYHHNPHYYHHNQTSQTLNYPKIANIRSPFIDSIIVYKNFCIDLPNLVQVSSSENGKLVKYEQDENKRQKIYIDLFLNSKKNIYFLLCQIIYDCSIDIINSSLIIPDKNNIAQWSIDHINYFRLLSVRINNIYVFLEYSNNDLLHYNTNTLNLSYSKKMIRKRNWSIKNIELKNLASLIFLDLYLDFEYFYIEEYKCQFVRSVVSFRNVKLNNFFINDDYKIKISTIFADHMGDKSIEIDQQFLDDQNKNIIFINYTESRSVNFKIKKNTKFSISQQEGENIIDSIFYFPILDNSLNNSFLIGFEDTRQNILKINLVFT